tara:strand:- start:760 stop:1074 length:315 start_codon:yes stop_codon:yes gene_type:complete
MSDIKLGEFGQRIIFDLGEVVTGEVTMQLRPPKVSYEKVKTYPATVGDAPLNTDDVGLLNAYEYAYYKTLKDDIDVAGTWYARAISDESERRRKTSWVSFRVEK